MWAWWMLTGSLPTRWAQGKANSQKDVIKVRCMGTGQ